MGNLQCLEPENHVIDTRNISPPTNITTNETKENAAPVESEKKDEVIPMGNNTKQENIDRDIWKFYDEIKEIGGGSMGHMSLVRKKGAAKGDKEYAMQTIKLDRISSELTDELRNEIDKMKRLDHPNIVKAHEVYECRNQIFIVMDECKGGNLSDRSPFTEWEASRLVRKILHGVAHMHKEGVIHHDLKIENIMFEHKKKSAEPMILDFGLSKKFMKGEEIHQASGNLYTMAPDVFTGNLTEKADMWSIGVLTYTLLSTLKPFWSDDMNEMRKAITDGNYNFNNSVWDRISPGAKKFISALLVVDPNKRLSAQEAIDHDWLKSQNKYSVFRPDENLLKVFPSSLAYCKESNLLKKIALMVIAHKSTPDDVIEMRKMFMQFDTKKDGYIDYDGFEKVLSMFNYPLEEIKETLDGVITNNGGGISWTEFLVNTLEAQGNIKANKLKEAFDLQDTSGDGYIGVDELKEILGSDYSEELVQTVLSESDADEYGRISYNEFLHSCKQKYRLTVKEFRVSVLDEQKSVCEDSKEIIQPKQPLKQRISIVSYEEDRMMM